MKIIGTGSELPRKIVTNDMLSEFLDTSDAWIYPRTGIRQRHVISDERLEDLAISAAKKALDNAGMKAEDLDFIICSNVVNEYITPSLSCIIQGGIGATCPCLDINCACAGFIYALDIAETHYKAGKVKNVLIVCAEEPSRMTSWKDRSVCVLFGDGAGAAVPTASVSPRTACTFFAGCFSTVHVSARRRSTRSAVFSTSFNQVHRGIPRPAGRKVPYQCGDAREFIIRKLPDSP